MSEIKKNAEPQEKKQPAGKEPYELYYLEEKLGVSRDQVMAAIEVVGTNRHQVEGYLRRLNTEGKNL